LRKLCTADFNLYKTKVRPRARISCGQAGLQGTVQASSVSTPYSNQWDKDHDLTALFGPRAHSEEYFAGLAKDPSLKVKLTGSWETLIGPVDNFGE
jgi:hypothetical protein